MEKLSDNKELTSAFSRYPPLFLSELANFQLSTTTDLSPGGCLFFSACF